MISFEVMKGASLPWMDNPDKEALDGVHEGSLGSI